MGMPPRLVGPLAASLLAASLLIAALLITPTAALATAPGPPAASGTRTVDLVVALPAAHPVPRGAVGALRAEELAALVPTAATRLAVVARAHALGLTTGDRDGVVTATGAASLVDRLFPSAGAHGLAVPAALRGLVTTVADPADTTPLWHRFDTAAHPTSGGQLDAAYGVTPLPATTPPALTPSTGVVATLQLSGWDSRDLSQFAASVYGPGYDPVASGQYTPVSVGRSPALTTADGTGDAEVALDQEALLSAAPQLRQRAYFAPNSTAGVAAALDAVLADVQAGVPVLAFSSSYGACESDTGAGDATAIDQRLQALVAAGVTVFASTGDSGRFCSTSTTAGVVTDVETTFPASSPSALAVGGTRHENGPGRPLPDTAWDEGGAGAKAGGSGGGTSTLFARPGYQAGLAPAGTSGAGSGRLVPDLALDADPATGMVIVNRGAQALTGGTSLSAPVAAAQVADLIVARAPAGLGPVGLGDLHPLLYGTPAGLTDVTRVQDGTTVPADQPTGPGYDLATGLGTPDWTTLAGPLFSTAPPGLGLPATSRASAVPISVTPAGGVAAAQVFAGVDTDPGCGGPAVPVGSSSLTVPEGTHTIVVHTLTRSGRCSLAAAGRVLVDSRAPSAAVTSFGRISVVSQVLSLRWGGSDPAPGTGVTAYDVLVTHKGGARPDFSRRVPATTTSATVLVVGGADEVLQVTPVDGLGNVGAPARSGPVDVIVDDRTARLSRGWVKGKAPHTYSGTVSTTSTAGATASMTLRGSVVGLLATTRRDGGRVQLLVDGKVVRTVSLRSSSPGVRRSYFVRVADRTHAVVVRSLGGGPVVLDGLIVG